MLADQAVVVPSEATARLGAAAREANAYLVIGVDEREPAGSTIYNTLLYFDPQGNLLGKHRKLMPTGSERTVWGMGDGSTLDTYPTPFGRLGGLICWENYMPLARFYLYSQGVDVWVAPTLAPGDGWIATMQHIAREGRCFVIGANPCVRVDQIPADFPDRERVWPPDPDNPEWVEPGNTVIVDPDGGILAGPARHEETILVAELDLSQGAFRAAEVRSGGPLQPARCVSALRRHGTAPSGHRRWTTASPTTECLPGAQAQVPQKVRYFAAKSSGAGFGVPLEAGPLVVRSGHCGEQGGEWLQVTGGGGIERLLHQVVARDVDGVDPCHRLGVGAETAPLFEPGIEPRQVEHEAPRPARCLPPPR